MSNAVRIAATIQPKIAPLCAANLSNVILINYYYNHAVLVDSATVTTLFISFNTSTLNADGTELTGPTEPPTTKWFA